MILDEPTSSLDGLAEKRFQENLKTILTGRTALLIAHHVATIQQADRILVLQDGDIVEERISQDLIEQRRRNECIHR